MKILIGGKKGENFSAMHLAYSIQCYIILQCDRMYVMDVYTLGGRGNWTSEGCQAVDSEGEGNKVICHCNHLTNFAILVVRGSTSCA